MSLTPVGGQWGRLSNGTHTHTGATPTVTGTSGPADADSGHGSRWGPGSCINHCDPAWSLSKKWSQVPVLVLVLVIPLLMPS